MNHSLKYQYTNVSIEELQIMERINLSGFHTRVYLAIKSFAYGDKKSSFPSYKTIAKALEMESQNFQSLLSRAIRKLVSVGLIIKNEPTSKDRYVFTSKSSSDNKVVRRKDLTKQSREPLDQTVKRRAKGSNNPLFVSNDTALSINNIERLLFRLIDPRTLTWKPSEVRIWANKWVKVSRSKTIEVLLQHHKGKPFEVIVEESVAWLVSHRGYEPCKSQTPTPFKMKTKTE